MRTYRKRRRSLRVKIVYAPNNRRKNRIIRANSNRTPTGPIIIILIRVYVIRIYLG